MPRSLATIAVLTLVGATGLGVSVAFANWGFGCDYSKCVSACMRELSKPNKVCERICDQKFSEKRAAKSCN